MSGTNVRTGVFALALALCALACSDPAKGPAASQPPSTPAAGADARPAKVPILEGYKYYVGGPLLKKDAYGRERIAKFLGEVEQPPARGMVIGSKVDGDHLEYRVWVNGRAVGVYRGVVKDGTFWREFAETYRGEKPVARETTVNDDAAEVMHIKTEDVDPVTGETIRVTETTKPYKAPELPPLPDDDEEDSDQGGQGKAAPAPRPSPGGGAAGNPAAPGAK